MKMNRKIIRTYSELISLPTFEERYEYLKLGGKVGEETFGFDRYLNQMLYTSNEWRSLRHHIITRDGGCDLAMPGRDIPEGVMILIHHMNPITVKDVINRSDYVFNPEYLISTIKITHDAIHYGNSSLLYKDPIVRSKNDTCPWRHRKEG